MALRIKPTYTKNEVTTWSIPNYWDIIAMVLVFAGIILLAWHAKQMIAPYHLGDTIPISLDPIYLPTYALRTTLRLFIALFFSLVFTFIFGAWAAKNKHAERLIIPAVDVLQSVPVLSFLAIAAPFFIFIFSNSIFGPECAAIFGIFTAQVWNMTLSFYQGVKTVPNNLKEAARAFRLSAWQCFWRVEVPFSMPGLLWNIMISTSSSWFFVVACEVISLANQDITLPGVGSYIALAIAQKNSGAIVYAICCMLIVIFLYDQLLFRPLIYWAEKFKEAQDDDAKPPRAWIVNLFQQTKLLRSTSSWFSNIGSLLINLPILTVSAKTSPSATKKTSKFFIGFYYFTITLVTAGALFFVGRFIFTTITFTEAKHIMWLGIFTSIRIISMIFLASLIWVPIGVWIGLRPKITAIIQPIIQFAVAFPINLLFPTVAMLIITFKLNVEVWVAPLMVLGTQWYILFNVIAGASALPKELKLAAANFKVTGFLWWRRFILPGIAPSFITGAISATGGAWNASIAAEAINWGTVKLHATGLGAYIQQQSAHGDFPRIISGTIAMCIIVLLINRLFWRPLYNIAVRKFQSD
ncbi:MAG: ABC transporter permease subunit [bacterium]